MGACKHGEPNIHHFLRTKKGKRQAEGRLHGEIVEVS